MPAPHPRPRGRRTGVPLPALTLLASLALFIAPSTARDFVPLTAPQGARVERLGEAMRLNGHPARIEHVVAAGQPADALLRHYRQQLRPHAIEWRHEGTVTLGSFDGERAITVRVRPAAGGSEAWVMQMRPDPARRDVPTYGFEFAAGARVLTSTESLDNGRRAVVVTASNDAGLEANREFTLRRLSAQGYRQIAGGTGADLTGDAVVLMFQRGSDDAVIALTRRPGGGTHIVVNATERLARR